MRMIEARGAMHRAESAVVTEVEFYLLDDEHGVTSEAIRARLKERVRVAREAEAAWRAAVDALAAVPR